jgi:hypothetical protein
VKNCTADIHPLITKSRRDYYSYTVGNQRPPAGTGKNLGLSLEGPDPCVPSPRLTAGGRSPSTQVGFGTQDGVNLGTVVPSKKTRKAGARATASNLDTLLGRGIDRRVRMLLSFQRPSHLLEKGCPSQGRARDSVAGSRGGLMSIDTRSARGQWRRRAPRRRSPARAWILAQSQTAQAIRPSRDHLDGGHETTWTVTVRVLGRSSKSISTSCCHVPRASVPSSTGTVSEGPITAARRCA